MHMPFIYGVSPGTNITTNGTVNTDQDDFFVKPGAGRSMSFRALYVHGKAAALTAISSIGFRAKTQKTTASSAGNAITPEPRDGTVQAAKSSAAANAGTAITAGTGPGGIHFAIGCGAGGPGGYVAPDPDSYITLEAGATKSVDVFSNSGTASLKYDATIEIVE
jgi:hypothetical protein